MFSMHGEDEKRININLKRNRPLGRIRHRWEDNIKICFE